MVAALLVTAVLFVAIVVGVRYSSSDPTRVTHALAERARSFQTAWLAGDLPAARTFVLETHRSSLERWTLPRRAALVASFGERFDANVTDVEVVQQGERDATIRVRFTIRGHQQQAFQSWKKVGSSWSIMLDSARSAAPRDKKGPHLGTGRILYPSLDNGLSVWHKNGTCQT
jgi:hypothetical protein